MTFEKWLYSELKLLIFKFKLKLGEWGLETKTSKEAYKAFIEAGKRMGGFKNKVQRADGYYDRPKRN